MFAQDIPGGAGDVGDDGGLTPGQGVEQAGLAGIGATGDHHGHAVAQQGAAVGFALDLVQFGLDTLQQALDPAVGEEVDLFLGKVDGRLDIDAQADQLFDQALHPAREFALQRTQGIARRLFGARLDEVGDGFGLGQVELVVEKGAFAEFTRPGQARTLFQGAAQQQVEDHRAAMALEFQHVFAGEGVGTGKEQRDAGVQHAAVGGEEVAVVGMPGRQLAAADRPRQRGGQGTGDADDADPATPGGGGDGGDTVGRQGHDDPPESTTPQSRGVVWTE